MNQKTIITGAVVALGAYLFIKHEASTAVVAVGEAVNPTNQDNIFYTGINAVVDVFDDGQQNRSNTFGTWLYELTHDEVEL